MPERAVEEPIGCPTPGACSCTPRVEFVVDEGTVRSLEREIARLGQALTAARKADTVLADRTRANAERDQDMFVTLRAQLTAAQARATTLETALLGNERVRDEAVERAERAESMLTAADQELAERLIAAEARVVVLDGALRNVDGFIEHAASCAHHRRRPCNCGCSELIEQVCALLAAPPPAGEGTA